jgi:hypothetical protein
VMLNVITIAPCTLQQWLQPRRHTRNKIPLPHQADCGASVIQARDR